MYILLADETNKAHQGDVRFFVYGGICFHLDKLPAINAGIEAIRIKAGYKVGDEFKFDTRSRPEYVSIKECTEAKKQAVELCLENDVNFIVHVVHHEIIKYQAEPKRIWGGANYVIGRFNFFLRSKRAHGICLLDNFETSSQYKYIAEKFQRGLVTPRGDLKLDRIQLLGTTCVNASHANSAMDIVLGSFRFCINNPKNIEVASDMMPRLVKMLWTTKDGDRMHYPGFILRPEMNQVETHYKFVKKDYDELLDHIDSLCPGI